MIALLFFLARTEEFPYQVDLRSNGQTFEKIGRAQFQTKVDPRTETVTKTFRYESADRDVITRQEEVYDRDGRLQSYLAGQTLTGEAEEVVELKKIGGKWSLTSGGQLQKDDFPVTISDPTVVWWLLTKPEADLKIKIKRFDGRSKVQELNAIFHGTDEIGRSVERWTPGFREKAWYDEKGQLVRMEVSHPPDDSTLIYSRVDP